LDQQRSAVKLFVLIPGYAEKMTLSALLTFVVDSTVNRYLTPPSRFRVATGKKTAFASRLQVEEFIKREFPNIDPSTFFSMFIWKIPAKGHSLPKG
jgi:hypothetical protein